MEGGREEGREGGKEEKRKEGREEGREGRLADQRLFTEKHFVDNNSRVRSQNSSEELQG